MPPSKQTEDSPATESPTSRDNGDRYAKFTERVHTAIEHLKVLNWRRALIIAGFMPVLAVPLIGCGPDMKVEAAGLPPTTHRTQRNYQPTKFARLVTQTPAPTETPSAPIESGSVTPVAEINSSEFCQDNLHFQGYWPKIEKTQILAYCARGLTEALRQGVSPEIITRQLTGFTITRSSENGKDPHDIKLKEPPAAIHEYVGHGLATWSGDPESMYTSGDHSVVVSGDIFASVISESFAEFIYRQTFSWDQSVQTIPCGPGKSFDYRAGATQLKKEQDGFPGLWAQMATAYDSALSDQQDTYPSIDTLFSYLALTHKIDKSEVIGMFLDIYKASCHP